MHVSCDFDLLATVQVSNASMLALRHQKRLTDLDLHDCIKLTDEGVACLQGKTTQQQPASGLILHQTSDICLLQPS